MPKVSAKPQRIQWVDELRGLAIVLMIIFHFCYDLRYFGYVDWSIPNGQGWWQFRYLILSLFIFTVGLSISLAHFKKINTRKFLIRLAQIALAAIAITLMSLVLFPQAWIYFGILHFIIIASILGLPLVKYPRAATFIGSLILFLYWAGLLNSEWPFLWLEQFLPEQTEDFVPVFPWLGVMALGVGLMGLLKKQAWQDKIQFPKYQFLPLGFMGRHGLLIYLVHQPIFFAGFIAVNTVFN
jgi:uncharacterized membrane protein